MKKSLLFFTLAAFGFAGFAQTFVSTSPENKNIVLEEFTGIYCGYCPDGHRLAQELSDNNPGDVVLVNIHVGSYAAPNGADPDFRTSFGTAIDGQAGVCGYPAGTINRHYFPNAFQTDQNGNPCGTEPTAQSRGSWASTGGTILGESSPVNVAAQAALDLSTGELTVVAEAYYTGNGTGATNYLNVAVLQSGVTGPQSGASANPTQVNPDGTYTHNHMLRHLMTGQWGADVTPTTAGSFFTETYTWDVPADINGVPVDLNNLEVVVFVSEGQEEVITGAKATLDIASPNAYDALPAGVTVPEYVCESEISPMVTIQNMGNETMTNLAIAYSVNGGPATTYNWTGSLATASTEDVTLPAISFTHLPTNTFWVATQAPNGQADQVTSNDIVTQTFEPSKNSGNVIDIEIVTDNYGYETYWEVQDENGTTVASGGNANVGINGGGLQNQALSGADPGAYGNNVTVTEQVTLTGTGCHSFIIVDDYGDGMCCAYGEGSYEVASGGIILYTGGALGSDETRGFNVGGTNGINNLSLIGSVNVFPNPFSDNAQVSFNLVETGVVSLEVYNVLGAKVISENLGEKAAGAHTTNISSVGLESGVYMVNLLVEGAIFSTRVNIAK
ncbi:Omp28-related outer membrane protein [Flavobacteriales bacterium]|nr:Omp28-related outer membrane protein [Flavobacteriales bacterium]